MNGTLNVNIGVLPQSDTDIGKTTHSRWLANVDPRDAAEAARGIREAEQRTDNGDVMNIYAAFAAALEDFARAEAAPGG